MSAKTLSHLAQKRNALEVDKALYFVVRVVKRRGVVSKLFSSRSTMGRNEEVLLTTCSPEQQATVSEQNLLMGTSWLTERTLMGMFLHSPERTGISPMRPALFSLNFLLLQQETTLSLPPHCCMAMETEGLSAGAGTA